MNAREILDNAVLITARQDVRRPLLLMMLNTVRRALLRQKTIRKFFDYRTMPHVGGVIDASGVKLVRTLEYVDGAPVKLARLKNMDDARRRGFVDFTATGTPTHYLDYGARIQVLPVPTAGSLKAYGEFWPAELADDAASSDIITEELADALVYLTAGEYFHYLAEFDKGDLWRQKGWEIVDQYLAQDKKQAVAGFGLTSDPLGNGGITYNKFRTNE